MRDGRIVEVMEVVGVEGSRVLFERYLPLHDTVLKRYRVANVQYYTIGTHCMPDHCEHYALSILACHRA